MSLPTRTFNLVYDKWDESNVRILNCSEYLGNHPFRDEVGFLDFYNRFCKEYYKIDYNIFNFEKYKIDDVYNNSHKKFFYFIKIERDLTDVFVKYTNTIDCTAKQLGFEFSDILIKCLKECNNLYVVFLYEHESDHVLSFLRLREKISEHNLDESKFIILNNNSNLTDYLTEFDSQIQVHKLKMIDLTATLILNELDIKFKPNKEGKLFLCHNKSIKHHRVAFLTLLKYHNLLDDINWSLVPGHGLDISHKTHVRYFLPEEVYVDMEDYIWELLQIGVKKSDYEIDKPWFYNENLEINREGLPHLTGLGGVGGGMMVPEHTLTYENSYINIITESQFHNWKNIVHISEKTIRPFWAFQIPIFVATQNHIKKIKSEYDFDFFDDLVDHGYDGIKNEKERLTAVVKEVKRLNNMKSEVIEFYQNNYERFKRNHDMVKNILNDKTDINYFVNL